MQVPNRPSGLIRLMAMTLAVSMAVLLVAGRAVVAQTASPSASPGPVICDVEPRTDEEIEQLAQAAATPAADSDEESLDDTAWDGGVAADDQTTAEIESTLALIDACSAAGDLSRLLALYTDEFIVREVLATEPVPIMPGTPDASASTGTPEAAGTTTSVIEVRLLPDGRAAAQVERDGRTEIVILVEVDERWLVDAVTTTSEEDGTPNAGVSDELASKPPVQAAITDCRRGGGIAGERHYCYGCRGDRLARCVTWVPAAGSVLRSGRDTGVYRHLDVAGTEMMYHTDEGEAVVPCESWRFVRTIRLRGCSID